MKTMKNILLFILPLLALLSCSEQMECDIPADNKLSTTISVILPQLPDAHPQTRAMAVEPDMQNLYVAVFDKNGYLLEYVEADKTSTDMAEENGTNYTYKVSLTPTNSKTIVHFIGNAPKTSLDFGSEEEVLSSLYTEGGKEAYWQRVELTDGIKNDQATVDALTGVKLIRNFAWINVISTDDKFTIDSYCVVNTRTKGSIAPYNSNTRQFVNFEDNKNYTSITGSGINQDGTNQDGYNGFIPASATIDKNIPEESNWFQASPQSSSENYAYFVYEREKALSEPPFILIKATYHGTSERYYKVDLRDSDGNYFPIVRNFKYRINITGVGHSGYDYAEDAANGAGSGDVSSALETQSFNNISNGEARLFVSYTDTTIVDYKPDETYKLRYKYIVYITDSEGNVKEDNRTQTATVESEGTVIPTQTDANGTVLPEYAIKHITDKTNEWYGWSEITFSTTALPTAPNTKTQQFIITGTDNEYSLHRKVNITLRNKFDFIGLVCDPIEIPTATGKPFDVIVKVPGGLGRSMFPLDIQLEAANQSMTPNLGDNLPTVTGPSIVPDKNKTTIGFIKQINWVEYEEYFTENLGAAFMPARCHFKSNKSNAAGSTTTIYASNKYFNQTNAPLGYFDAEQFTNLKFSTQDENLPSSINQSVSFTFNMSELPSQVTGNDGTVTVALCNLMPAGDDQNKLTQVGVDTEKGIAYYSFTPTSTNNNNRVELKLKNTDVNVEAKVMLSSYHFENAERAMNYTKGTFNYLSLTPVNKYLAKDSEVTFKFRLSRQVKTGRYITVTLGNLVPADTEKRLALINEKDGTYRLDPTDMAANTDITLYLKVKNAYQTVSAKLSADYFEDSNEVSKNPETGSFTGLKLTATDTKLTANSNVTCSFTVPAELPGGYILITLDNLVTTEGKTSYKYYPEANELGKQKTLTFTVEESYKPVKVTLSADCFNSDSETLNPVIQIPARNIKVKNSLKNYTFSVYATNPGTSNVTAINSFKPTNSSGTYSNSNPLDVGEYYQTIMDREGEDKGYVFIRYQDSQRRYYVAKVLLETLMTTGVTLDSDDFI